MTLSDLAAIGSFISGVAVVFSFVFLALQMRQANINQKAIVHQTRTSRTVDLAYRFLDPALRAAIIKGSLGETDLSQDNYVQYSMVTLTTLWNFEDSFFQHRIGLMEDGAFEAVVQRYRRRFSTPGLRALWHLRRDEFDPAFAHYCDRIAAESLKASPILSEFDDWLKLVEREKSLQEHG